MEIVASGIEPYLLGLSKKEDPILSDMEAYARKKPMVVGKKRIPFPIVGPLVGRLLEQFTRTIGAKKIIELGSGFGYSAYWFARAMGEDGEITLTDTNREHLEAARKFLARVPRPPRCLFQHGNALDILDDLEGPFDIVFVDIDKHQYPQALRRATRKIRRGGLLIADNVLWSGEVIKASAKDAATEGIRAFNRLIHSDPKLLTTVLPLRDGLAVCLKL